MYTFFILFNDCMVFHHPRPLTWTTAEPPKWSFYFAVAP